MSPPKRNLLASLFSGCRCGSRRSILPFVHLPSPKSSPSSSSDTFSKTSATSSESSTSTRHRNAAVRTSPASKIGDIEKTSATSLGHWNEAAKIGDSIAIVKDSEDPYGDFRQSMLQMIFEREIYSKDDLQELLHCFLKLNSPSQHGIIIQAFVEIWNGVVSPGAATVTDQKRGRRSSTWLT